MEPQPQTVKQKTDKTYSDKMKFRIPVIALIAFLPAVAQEIISPETIYSFGPIDVQKPVLLDSTNLSNTKFNDELLLSYKINFPQQTRFVNQLRKDSLGFFNLDKPKEGKQFQLMSFFIPKLIQPNTISMNQYSKMMLDFILHRR